MGGTAPDTARAQTTPTNDDHQTPSPAVAKEAPRWLTSGGAPSAHVAALTAHGGSLTAAFAVPIWTRVMGQTNQDDGPGR